MITAMIWKGKGNSSADWFKPVSFGTREEFDAFKAKTDDMESKYWTQVLEFAFTDEEDDIPYRN